MQVFMRYYIYSVNLRMYNTVQILKILKAKKLELEKKYPISEMALFGSYARGDYCRKLIFTVSRTRGYFYNG